MNAPIKEALRSTVDEISFPEATVHHKGKVRESFVLPDGDRAIVVTDRVSAFDYVLGTIPFKGQVLNQIAAWWFRKLEGVVPHHLIDVPDPNVSLVKNVTPLPVEIIVRAYLTGSTKTSSWHAYKNLNRMICGIEMPDGMKKNQPFVSPFITPTTKPESGHDEAISREEILNQGLVSESIYTQAEAYALKMFALGQKVAAERGLILVDTKYEMGIDQSGYLIVIDEVHTPDSSRYWVAESYPSRFDAGEEPESLDKEFVRRMLVDNGIDISADPTSYDGRAFLDEDLRIAAAKKYIQLYEKMTGESFVLPENFNTTERIEKTLKQLLRKGEEIKN